PEGRPAPLSGQACRPQSLRARLTPVVMLIPTGRSFRTPGLRAVHHRRGGVIMLHEMRIYRCLPGRLPDLLKRFEAATLKLWDKHGIRHAGFWTVQIGENSNDLYYLLEWDNLAEREERWNAFAADPEWAREKAETEKH